MKLIDERILDALRARSRWSRGGRIPLSELCGVLASRFPGEPTPTAGDVIQSIRRLRLAHYIKWAAVDAREIRFLT